MPCLRGSWGVPRQLLHYQVISVSSISNVSNALPDVNAAPGVDIAAEIVAGAG